MLGQPVGVHPLDIPAHRISAHRHGPVEPRANGDGAAAFKICGEPRRNFQSQTDFTRPHPVVQIGMIDKRRFLVKVTRPGQVVDIGLAKDALIEVEHRKFEVFDIHGYAIAQHDHQDHAAETGKRQADRIAAQLQRLAP